MKKKRLRRPCNYCLMLMRDDGSVRSIKIKRRTLQVFKVLILIFALLGSSGIAIGYYYFDVIQNYKSNKEELAMIRAKLTQLSNYEKLAEVTATPLTPIAKNEQIAVAETSPVSQNIALNSTKESFSKEVTANSTANSTVEKATFNATTVQTENAKKILLIESEESPLRVANFTARNGVGADLRIRYELVSSPQDQMSRGTVSYSVTTNEGKTFTLKVKSPEDMYFSLYRMKVFDFTIGLPQGIAQNNVQSITLTLHIDTGKSFVQVFPFSQ